jgi:hypothetical protein
MQQQAAVHLTTKGLSIHHPMLFSQGGQKLLREFTHRAFTHYGTHRVTISPQLGRAEITFNGDKDVAAHAPPLIDLFSDINDSAPSGHDLPRWPWGRPVQLTRWRGVVTTLPLKEHRSGWVSVNLSGRARAAFPINHFPERLRGLPGVIQARASLVGAVIHVRIDEAAHPLVWIRTLEDLVGAHGDSTCPMVPTPKSPFATAHLNLALCTAGQFMFPVILPVASGVLIITRYPHLKEAAREFRKGRIGAPAFGTVVLACSVAGAAPFASALAEWLGTFWQRSWRRDIVRQTRTLLEDLNRDPLLEGEGDSVSSTSKGQEGTLRLEPGDLLPVDARIVSGEILVQDALRDFGPFRTTRKSAGDLLESGHRLLAGEAIVAPLHAKGSSRLEYVTEVIRTLPERIAHDPRLRIEARRLADKSVAPNLAIAGAALATGGLHMASAVLHQDWINAPFIAAPTEFFDDLRSALREGALIKTPAALLALAECQLLILDSRLPFLSQGGLEVVSVDTHLMNPKEVLTLAAAAAEFLGDHRADALRTAAHEAEVEVTPASLIDFNEEVIATRIGQQTVTLRNVEGLHQTLSPDLEVVVDSQRAFFVRFGATKGSAAHPILEHLAAQGLRPVLHGSNDPETLALGEMLGVEVIAPSLEGETLGHFIRKLDQEGYRCAFLTIPETEKPLTALAHVVLTAGGPKGDHEDSQILLLDDSLEALPHLLELGRSHAGKVFKATSKTIPANLLCIAGAFTGTLNGTTSTMLAHSGVMAVTASQKRLLARGRTSTTS